MTDKEDLRFDHYRGEHQLPLIQKLIIQLLSEPYSIFTYRYFVNNWPHLTLLAFIGELCVGTIVCKLEKDKYGNNRGYIAMLAVDRAYRKRGIGTELVKRVVNKMKTEGADVVVLETECTNTGALGLYERLSFVRDKRLPKYYLNGVDAFRLKYWLTLPAAIRQALAAKSLQNGGTVPDDSESEQQSVEAAGSGTEQAGQDPAADENTAA
eukprot:g78218.t1